METLNYLLTFAIFCFIFGTLFVLMYFAVTAYMSRQMEKERDETKYLMKYLCIQEQVKVYEVSQHNFSIIMEQLIELGQMRYKDRERTSVLTCNFLRKYGKICDEKLISAK